MARTKLEFGYSANDGRGFILQEGAMYVEEAFSELYMFLSGGQSETKLPLALPRSRGGIGGIGEKGSKEFLGSQGMRMFHPILMKHVPVAYCTVGLGQLPKTHKVVELNSDITFIRTSEGTYKCTVFDDIAINGNFIYVQPDNYGNRKICGVPSHVGNEITITVHPLVFNSVTGLFGADTSQRIDVPSDTFISFILVNTLGVLL